MASHSCAIWIARLLRHYISTAKQVILRLLILYEGCLRREKSFILMQVFRGKVTFRYVSVIPTASKDISVSVPLMVLFQFREHIKVLSYAWEEGLIPRQPSSLCVTSLQSIFFTSKTYHACFELAEGLQSIFRSLDR
jgi:hypothetical protein